MRRGVGTVLAILVLSMTVGSPTGALATLGEHHRTERLIVRLSGSAAGPAEVAGSVGGDVVRQIPALDAAVIEVGGSPVDAAARLAARSDVVDVERDARAQAAEVTPDDERWDEQWGLAQLEAPAAWAQTTGSDDVTIAVLDTGIDAAHPDLADGVADGRNFTGSGDADDTSDANGHGTMVAGVAAARTDNDLGVAGTCWTCRLLPVKVMGPDGDGALSDIAAGMIWAVDEGADVLNMSLGSLTDSALIRDAVDYAAAHDVPVVAAAGNVGSLADGETPVYPAAYDKVIGVAANDEDGELDWRSSSGDWAEVSAAACNLTTETGEGYDELCGTSSATPLVAGVAALAVALEPSATHTHVAQAITSSAIEADYVEHGRVDADAALTRLGDLVAEGDDGSGSGDEPGVAVHRVAGADRFDTAAQLSQSVFEPGVDRVYVATGTDFADALAAGASAGVHEAPVLLASRSSLPTATRDELARLQPDEVVIVGGEQVLDAAVATRAGEAAGARRVERVAGDDRFATAAQVADHGFTGPVDTAFVATGTDFADALAGVPAAVAQRGPVLLATADELPDATREALAALAPERIVVLGGPAAVGTGVESELAELAGEGGVDRHGGSDRFETAARVASTFAESTTVTVHLATGADFPDALAGGPVAGMGNGPVLLATRDELPEVTAAELRRLRPFVHVVLGGEAVISEQVQDAAGEASAGG